MFMFIVCVSPSDGHDITDRTTHYCSTAGAVQQAVDHLTNRYPTSPVYMYKLDTVQKLVGSPKYAQYQVNNNGEIVPK